MECVRLFLTKQLREKAMFTLAMINQPGHLPVEAQKQIPLKKLAASVTASVSASATAFAT